ncbi:hypothetical protein AB0M28_15690 [Streptomyces sp. NPDC051940]|uniref:hypothetical protein n=1 Tax=Streptomyces sp. NPDC051940 TaxID=3155675 RepID=UPI003421FEAA
MPFHPPRLLLPPLALLVAAGAAAWTLTIGQGSGPVRAAAPDPARVAEWDALPPLYAALYVRTEADERTGTAQQRLIVRCMARQGFTYHPPPVARAGDRTLSRPTPFGIEERGQIAAMMEQTVPAERPQGEAYGRALLGDPDKQLKAATGDMDVVVPAEGCQAEAEWALQGDGRLRRLELRMRLGEGERAALDRLSRDEEFDAATAAWRACMDEAGVTAHDPADLLRAVPEAERRDSHPAIVADLDCKARTGYLRTAYTRLAALQRQWLARNPDVLPAWNALMEHEQRAARAALDDPGTTDSR